MIDLQYVVTVVLYLLVAGAVFGLLLFLIDYVARQFPSEPMSLFAKFARVALIVIAVVVLIFVLISMVNGGPVFRWGPPPTARP
jgi:hypothetical protein